MKVSALPLVCGRYGRVRHSPTPCAAAVSRKAPLR